MLDIIKAIVLGIIQGITEWLPISSTGHMILADQLIHLNVSENFMNMFLVVIQLGSILAVVVLYFHKLNPFSPKKTPKERQQTLSLWLKVLVGVIPVGVAGLLFDDAINAVFYKPFPIAIALMAYGVAFILIESRASKSTIDSFEKLDYKTIILIGLFQTLALIPGTSRSGSTILGAILLGTSRTLAAEFSFFMPIPAMLGASGLKLLKFGFDFTGTELAILAAGLVSAFAVSIAAIRFLMNFIRRKDFKPFGYYRIALGVLVILFFAFFRG